MADSVPEEGPIGKPSGEQPRNFIRRHPDWIGLALVAATFVLAAFLSWRKWPDVLGDFGTELYIPWRLSVGAVLFRDLFFVSGGPLSQYYHALLFKIFGVSFLTLIISNLLLVAATILLIYRRFLAVSDAWTAMTIGLGIVLVFVFNQYIAAANFNYIAPYSSEAVHGLVLSIFTIALLSDWIVKERCRSALAAGFCSGLVFLTKPDIFIALAVSVGAAFVLFCITRRRVRFAAKSLLAFLLAALVPLTGFFLYFLTVEDWRTSLRSVFFALVPLQTTLIENPLYQWCTGLDNPRFHLEQMACHFFVVMFVAAFYAVALRYAWQLKLKPARSRGIVPRLLLLLVLISIVAFLCANPVWLQPLLGTSLREIMFWFLFLSFMTTLYVIMVWCQRPMEPKWTGAQGIILLILIFPLLVLASGFNWVNCGASLPLLSLSACVLICWNYKRLSAKQEAVFPLLWSVFGLVLLAKLGLFSRIWHYGFALALPAFVSAIYLLLWLIPLLLKDKFAVPSIPFRTTIWLALMIGFGWLFNDSESLYSSKKLAVGRGSDRIMVSDTSFDSKGEDIKETLAWIEKNVPSDATLAALPEGIALNYLSRRINPTPCLYWDINSIPVFGETSMTATFEKNPPDYIFIVDRFEFGIGYFGQHSGYGVELMQWVDTHYRPVHLIGAEPLQGGGFGVKILKRLPSADAVPRFDNPKQKLK